MRTPIELPTMAARQWFHAIGGAIVGGATKYEIRAEGGEVTFTPGAVNARGEVVAGAPLRLRTKRVGRMGEAPGATADQSAVEGALHIRYERATEVWENGAESAEQSFRFEERPSGEGDVVVEIATSGLDCVETTALGLRFAAGDGSSGVLYGHGTFVDAGGKKTSVPASCDAEGITLRVPSAVVDGAAYPAVLDPVVGPSFEIEEPIPESTNADKPSVACSDSICLVTFTDDRDGTWRRYAGRFTPDGTMLDTDPHVLGTAASQAAAPVAFTQDRFLVVYSEGTSVYGQLIGVDGLLLSAPLLLGNNVSNFAPRVGCGPTDCLVTWVQSNILVGNRVTLDGTVMDGLGFVVGSPAYSAQDIAWAAGTYLATYRDLGAAAAAIGKRVVNGAVLDPSGLVLMPLSTFAPGPIEVAHDGAQFFVAIGSQNVWGIIVDPDGTLGPLTDLFPDGTDGVLRGLFWTGSKHAVIHRRYNNDNVAVLGVSSAGAPELVATDLWPDQGYVTQLAASEIVGGGGIIALKSNNPQGLPRPLEGLRIDADGQPVGTWFRISNGLNNQLVPTVAAGNGQYLVAWLDKRLTSAYAMASRVGADGSLLDENGIVLGELAPTNTNATLPYGGIDAVWNGSSYFIVWTDQTASNAGVLKGARLAPNGALLDTTPIAVATGSDVAQRPRVAWNGTSHMVTWRNSNPSTAFYYVARVDANGTALDPAGIQLGIVSSTSQPLLAWTGQEFLLVLGTGYRTISSGGVPLQSSLVAHNAGISPYSMSCSGTSCSFTGWASNTLRSVPFNALTKTAGAPTTIVSGADRPSATGWDGTRFIVVHGTNDLTAWSAGQTPAVVEDGPDLANAPRLASLGAGESLLAYTLRDDAAGGISRVYAAIISGGADNGVACTIAADCESGLCVDGVCCDAACGGTNTTDCQACSVAAGAAVNGTCSPIAQGTVCRTSAGVCDAVETCDGVSGSCPANGYLSGTVCRDAAGPCDVAEFCPGNSIQCPSNSLAMAGTSCRVAASECDVAETCTGVSVACPADAAVAPGTPCVGTPNNCVVKACTGTVGAAAFCQGTPKLAGTVCRVALDACDLTEVCDGTGAACPPDVLGSAGTVCRAAEGACDLAEQCDGASVICPVDSKVAAGTECRPADGECDVAEVCNGTLGACPADMGAVLGTPCGEAPGGPCQLPSSCAGGLSKVCEPNFEPAGTTCRPAAGPCDEHESCDGLTAACPDDALLAVGTVCNEKDPNNDCDLDDTCDGSSIECGEVLMADGADCETPANDSGTCESGECVVAGEGGSGGAGGSGGTTATSGAGGGSTTGETTTATGSGGGGGTPDDGGATSNSGSSSDDDGGARDDGRAAPDDGCSCRVGGPQPSSSSGIGLIALVAGVLRWRRARVSLFVAALGLFGCGDESGSGGSTQSDKTTASSGGADGAGGGIGGAGGQGPTVTVGSTTATSSSTGGPVDCQEITALAFEDEGYSSAYAGYSALLEPDLFVAADGDVIALQLFGAQGDDPGTYDLSIAPQDDYATCDRCFLGVIDYGTNHERNFFQVEGTLTLDPAADPYQGFIVATVTDLTLVEVTLEPGTFASTPVPGGACLHLALAEIEVGAPDDWACDPGHYGSSDGCQCGCGVLDPDCAGLGAFACDDCPEGSCATDGDDGCLPWLDTEDNTSCICSCAGLECGDDGCGNSCGSCGADEVCSVQGQCVCVPDCSAAECGPDGCGGSCGSCGANETCDDGLCVGGCGLTGTGTCVDLAPVGWAGPVIFYEGASTPPACPAAFPTELYTGHGALSCGAHTCSACSCGGTPLGGSCPASPDVTLYANSNCTGFYNHFTGPTGGCYSLSSSASGSSGIATIDYATGATCGAASGGVPTIGIPAWGAEARVCGGAIDPLGCGGGESCVEPPAAPFGAAICIAVYDDQDCPAASPYSTKHVFYTDFEDTRGCSNSCACSASGKQCSNLVNLLDGTCDNVQDVLPADGQCHNGSFYANGFSSTVGSPVDGTGTCNASGSAAPVGTCEGRGEPGDGAITVCCL